MRADVLFDQRRVAVVLLSRRLLFLLFLSSFSRFLLLRLLNRLRPLCVAASRRRRAPGFGGGARYYAVGAEANGSKVMFTQPVPTTGGGLFSSVTDALTNAEVQWKPPPTLVREIAYGNAGVMLMNVAWMRRTYDEFIAWTFSSLNVGRGLHFGPYGPGDQGAYNQFYAGRCVFVVVVVVAAVIARRGAGKGDDDGFVIGDTDEIAAPQSKECFLIFFVNKSFKKHYLYRKVFWVLQVSSGAQALRFADQLEGGGLQLPKVLLPHLRHAVCRVFSHSKF